MEYSTLLSLLLTLLSVKIPSASSSVMPLVSGRYRYNTPAPTEVITAYIKKVAVLPNTSIRLRKVADTRKLMIQLVAVAILMASALHQGGCSSLLIVQGRVPRPGANPARYRHMDRRASTGPVLPEGCREMY